MQIPQVTGAYSLEPEEAAAPLSFSAALLATVS